MKRSAFLLGACGLFVLAGCSVETGPDSITFKAQTKFNGTPVSKTAQNDWNGHAIEIQNANGDVTVQGDASVTKITVDYVPFAFADKEDEPSAQAAIREVDATLKIDESADKITITCGQASAKHGSANTGTTGCGSFTVKVPSNQGIALVAVSKNGSMTATGLQSSDTSTIDVRSDNGSVTATGIRGNAKVYSDNGSVTASLTPNVGSTLDVSTGNGDIDLALPSDFAADSLSLSGGSDGKDVKIEGFSDITAESTSRGTAGQGAKSITAKASSLGTLTVKTQ